MVLLEELNQITSNRERIVYRWGQLPEHVEYYSEALYELPPKKLSSLIVLPYSRSHSQADWTKLVAISNFRFQFSVIEELAKSLAPAVVELGIVPLIVPIHENDLNTLTWGTPIVKAMHKHGILMYEGSRAK